MSKVRGLELRIGLSDIFSFVGHDGKESFIGFFESILQLAHNWMKEPGLNLTIITSKEGFGTLNSTTKKYSGIFGMLQRNVVDMVFYPNTDFRAVQGYGVIRGQLMECDPPAIISAYDSRTRTSKVDILVDTLKDVGALNLSLFLIVVTISTYLLSWHNRGPSHEPIMSVITYLFQKIQIKVYNMRTALINFSLTISLFYFLLIFMSLLHVNFVKIDPPIVINSYEDLWVRLNTAPSGRPRFKVAWSLDFPDTELFREEDGSIESKIWKKNVQNGGPFFVKLGGNAMVRASAQIEKQDMVVILSQGYSYFVSNSLCDFNDDNPYFHSWISVDKAAKWNQKGYVIRESLSGPLRSFVDTRTQRILESGLMIYFNKASRELRVTLFERSKRANCSSESIVMDTSHQQDEANASLGFEQFQVINCTCAILILLAVITLIVERIPIKEEQGVWVRQVKLVRIQTF